ncbi:MAG: putative heme d1 biosynthesis radical SAM protein NirJ2 [Deltaproteobacteria bacterium]|nr:putative heme d1 biosynthesis radical SAM protein NirJ2 [Deltaproteobacteria bacterium]
MIISWNVTNECDLRCVHCYRDAGEKMKEELNTQEGKALLQQIAQAGFKIMIFSGGEPLMREDIFELVEYATQLGLRPVFGTNGILISPEIAQRLKSSGAAAMGISLDSIHPEKHDEFRGLPGAFQKTIKGIKNCREAGLKFQIHTTVIDWNYDEIEYITDMAIELGASAHHVFFLVPTGRAVSLTENIMKAEKYEQLLHRIIERQKEVPIELKPTCAPQFMRIAKQRGVEMRFQRGCIAGISYCLINPKGDVQPCAYLDIKLGNVREIPFTEIWKNNPILKELRTMNYTGACGVCKYKDICGGCRARAAYYHDGDYMAEEPWCIYSSA